MEFTASETNTYRMLGLSTGDSDQNYTDIDFAIYAVADATLQVYEGGVLMGNFGPYAAGDRLRVAVEGGVVKYKRNGVVIYTSTQAPQYPLLADTSLYSTGATIQNAVISGTLQSSGLNSPPIPRDGLSSVSYDGTSNRITTAGYAYDAAGNQTRVVHADTSVQQYQYDAAGRMVKVRNANNLVLATYTYGSSNQRLVSQAGDEQSSYRTYYAWGGDAVVAEYSENPSQPTSPQWTKSYVYLGARLLATLTPTGTSSELIQYHHPDRLGTRLVTNAQDTNSFEQVTLPFGTALDAESSGATNRRFTSYDRSSVTGLDYAVNRHYDSQQGRFTQVDPIGMSAASLSNPQSLNMYAYCGNDPINRVDPSGLFWGFIKRVIQRVLNAIVKAAVAAAIAFVLGGGIHGAAAAFAATFWKEIGRPSGWKPSFRRTPPIFPTRGPTLSQIFAGTILAPLFPSAQDFLSKYVIPFNPNARFELGSPLSYLEGTCGVNPITDEPGFTPETRGELGHLRPGEGGAGYFLARRGKRKHQGLDISAPHGWPAYANRAGTLTFVGVAGDAGNLVIIDHGRGILTRYAHLSRFAATIERGLKVDQGQIVGFVGQTGNAAGQPSTEEHLHFGVQINGKNVDPAAYLNSPCP